MELIFLLHAHFIPVLFRHFFWSAYTLIRSDLDRYKGLQNLSPKFPQEDILAYPNFVFGPFAIVLSGPR